MTTLPLATPTAFEERVATALRRVAPVLLRYALVFLVLLWGAFKFFEFEALAIKPLVENSPFVGWLYGALGVRGASAMFGVIEIITGLLIALWRFVPRASAYASLAAAGMFVVTLSFLFTTPNGFDNAFTGFLMKDVVLLAAALTTAAESFTRRGHGR